MKIYKIFSGIALIAVTGGSLYTTSFLCKDSSTSYEPRKRTVIRHAQDWNGAAEYYRSILANVNTGQVEMTDVLNARAAVKKHAAKKAGSMNLSWVERGPNNVGGRTRAILVDKNNSARVFAGGVSGGLFKSVNSASSWQPVSLAEQDNLIVTCIGQAPDGSIWFGTGSDFDASANVPGILFPGKGIFKSSDAGVTFQQVIGPSVANSTTDDWATVNQIAFKGNHVYAVTNKGLKISENNGVSWKNIWIKNVGTIANTSPIKVTIPNHDLNTGDTVAITGVQGNTAANGTWIITKVNTGDFTLNGSTGNGSYVSNTGLVKNCSETAITTSRGEDLALTSDGRLFFSLNGQIYYSDDPSQCASFVRVTGVGNTGGGRTDIAVAPSNSNYVYACVVDGYGHFFGVWKSTDKGITWSQLLFKIPGTFEPMTNAGSPYGQGVYDLAFAVAPDDPNKIFIGGVQLWMYNGNLTRIAEEFSNYPPYYVHADKHTFVFDPNNSDIMYVGTDGGIFKSFDQGNNFFAANTGYNVTQFYGMAFNNPVSGDAAMLGGTQDNGTILMKGESGNDYLKGDDMIGGDGFDADISSITGAMIGTLYYACLFRSSSIDNSFALITGDFAAGGFCGNEAIFHSVTRLWESNSDITSQDSILFTVDSTKQGIGTGNGVQKVFSGTLTPLQGAADVVIGSLRVQVGTSGTTFNDANNSSNDVSTFGSGGNTCTVTYSAKTFAVTFANAPSVNTPVWIYYSCRYYAGETLSLKSNTAEVPVTYTLTQNLNFGDSLKVQDPVQSIVALGVGTQGGVAINRNVLRFDKIPDNTWIKLNTTGTPSCIEFSKDGNHMFIGIENGGGVYRISGLNNVYIQNDVTGSPSKITKTKIFSNGNAITGIAVDSDNPENVVITVGNYGHTGYVYRSTNAVSATTVLAANFVDVSGDLPPMPVYDAEFINHTSKVVIGTEYGIYSTGDILAGSIQWANENNNFQFPHMPVYEVRQQKFYPSSNYEMLYIGTHGRGMWQSASLVTGVNDPSAESLQGKFLSDLTVFPNPVKENGHVIFSLQAAGKGNIRVFDLHGRAVKTMLNQTFASGTNKIKFDSANLPAGAYFITVEAAEVSSVAKFVVVK